MPTSGNFADEMLSVWQMLNIKMYLQKMKIEHSKVEISCIILYGDLQMLDFHKYVESVPNPRVGIDRTFNLGCSYVTSIVYKNHCVTKMDSNDHPIFLSPVCLHKEANFQKYHYFLSHVQCKLSIQIDNVDIYLVTNINTSRKRRRKWT